jgi:diguanylate cyclase (GGDEF)-like protein/PAS domain S-box-containing protein
MFDSKSNQDMFDYVNIVINMVREPLIMLDQDLRVVNVSSAFYKLFMVKPENTIGQLIYDLGNQQFEIPLLRKLLETVLPQKASFYDFVIEHNFALTGCRTLLLNARQMAQAEDRESIILLAIEDITFRADELDIANEEIAFQNEEKDKRVDELVIAKKEKAKRADELVIAKEEKARRANELVIAKEEKTELLDELDIAIEEKAKRADELDIAKKEKAELLDELDIAIEETAKRVDELVVVREEKARRADELVIVREEKAELLDELDIAIEEKAKRVDELDIAKEEQSKRADELIVANKLLAFQNEEKDKRADELIIANNELAFQNKEKDKRADELVIANKEKELLLRKLQRAASVFSHANEGIMITDATAKITEVNRTFSRITGYTSDEVLGKNPKILQSGRHSPEFYNEMWHTLLTRGRWRGELWNRRKNGEVFPIMLTISAVKNAAGFVQHYVSLCTDITTMKAYQGQLEHIAYYDVLTNLPNRVLLAERLSQAMAQCRRRNLSLAVVFMDLDGFKEVNDNHGHKEGDELLITVSQRMKEALREGDTLARIGGDEFIAVMIDLESYEESKPVLDRLLKAAAAPVSLNGKAMNISASIGVTLYPQDGSDADQLMRHADQAMYIAKQEGKNRYRLFDTKQENASKTQSESIGDIRSAMKLREFVLHYQPKVNMQTGAVIGVEALIRWQHPVLGLLLPLEFLPVIEGQDLSLELGEWVITSALSQISQWQQMDINLLISVNISGYQIQQSNFATRIADLLAAYPEVSPDYLEFEILETSALHDISKVSSTMNACHKLGLRFALDDFGTGYSSLTHLRRLPAQLIKIDQSFVRDMLDDIDDCAIVEGVIGLAKAFRRDVIAEGVETIAHGTALLGLGCQLAQGYGIARPMLASDIPAWITHWETDHTNLLSPSSKR